MNFLIINDLKYIFLKRKNWIILYLIIVLSFPIFCKANAVINDDLFFINNGLKFDNSSFLFIIIYIFNIIFYIFIYLSIHLGNLKIGVDNIFLRINKFKIVVSKIITCFVFTLLISSFVFAALSMIYNILDINSHSIFVAFIIFNIFNILIGMISIIIISAILYGNKKYILFLILIYMVYYISRKNILFFINPYLFENNLIDLIFFLIFNIIIYMIVLKKSIVKIFERSF